MIHYAGFNRPLRKGRVEEVSIDRFSRGRSVQVKACVAPRFSGAAAVERARTRLGENRYRFWSNNFEHFAEWCILGTSRSPQVEAWAQRLQAVTHGLAGLLAGRARVQYQSRRTSGLTTLIGRPLAKATT